MNSKDENDMRDQPDWMNPVDERIMEFLRDESVGTPKKIAGRLDKHNNYIGERCRLLASYDLVERVDRGVYVLADDGDAYLDEEIGADELESRDPDD